MPKQQLNHFVTLYNSDNQHLSIQFHPNKPGALLRCFTNMYTVHSAYQSIHVLQSINITREARYLFSHHTIIRLKSDKLSNISLEHLYSFDKAITVKIWKKASKFNPPSLNVPRIHQTHRAAPLSAPLVPRTPDNGHKWAPKLDVKKKKNATTDCYTS